MSDRGDGRRFTRAGRKRELGARPRFGHRSERESAVLVHSLHEQTLSFVGRGSSLSVAAVGTGFRPVRASVPFCPRPGSH
jgi:hypothetical protein